MPDTDPAPRVTAAILLIGDELLSGRTQDANLKALAQFLAPLGVEVAEARVVADVEVSIVEAVNALRVAHDYVFTTGGIGPTHDDITADAIAAAFGVSIDVRDDARAILEARYGQMKTELTGARLRMARIPDGATLIRNPVSGAPGFQLDNVFVLAGIPGVMKGMLHDVGSRLKGGRVMSSRTVRGAGIREGDASARLQEIENEIEGVSLGSYPYYGPEGYGAHFVARGADEDALERAVAALVETVRALGRDPVIDPED